MRSRARHPPGSACDPHTGGCTQTCLASWGERPRTGLHPRDAPSQRCYIPGMLHPRDAPYPRDAPSQGRSIPGMLHPTDAPPQRCPIPGTLHPRDAPSQQHCSIAPPPARRQASSAGRRGRKPGTEVGGTGTRGRSIAGPQTAALWVCQALQPRRGHFPLWMWLQENQTKPTSLKSLSQSIVLKTVPSLD